MNDKIHRQRASLSPLIHSQCQLQVYILHHFQPQPTSGVETPPSGLGNPGKIHDIHYGLFAIYLRYRMRYHPSLLIFFYNRWKNEMDSKRFSEIMSGMYTTVPIPAAKQYLVASFQPLGA